MENRLLETEEGGAVTKRRRTQAGWYPASTGEEINRTLKRRNLSQMTSNKKKKQKAFMESKPFKKGNYRGALHQWVRKRGYKPPRFDIKQKKVGVKNSPYICSCTTGNHRIGDITATGEARAKKQALQLSALAVAKKMKLIPVGFEHPYSKAKVVDKKTRKELLAERELDDENIYMGIVLYYRADKGYGFIAIDEEITFRGATAINCVYAEKDDIICYSDHIGMNTNSKVKFRVYKNFDCIGAYEITNDDGSPILFDPKIEAKVFHVKNLLEMEPMIEDQQYMQGNFLGALLRYMKKKSPGVIVKHETEFLQPYYIARCKAIGENTTNSKKIVGIGRASVKINAIQLASLDYLLKLNILTKNQHFRMHKSKNFRSIGDAPKFA